MDITQHPNEQHLELRLNGRFDANWSDHVGSVINTAVRSGQHHIILNFSGVNYISSAGIRVLLSHYKQLNSVKGSFRVTEPIESILKVFKMAGLTQLIVSVEQDGEPEPLKAPSLSWERGGVVFETHGEDANASLESELHGNPVKFSGGELSREDVIRVRCGTDFLGIGVGAFDGGQSDGMGRFGEFLAVAGSAVALPTDGSSMPDYQTTEGEYLPEAELLYGITARGKFPSLLRFEAAGSTEGVIGLSHLVEAAMESSKASSVAIVIVAESAGVVGASLRRSPDNGKGGSPFSFPQVRDWLSFTTESDEERALVLIVGFAERFPSSESDPFLRPIGPGTSAMGHFHAVTFPYHPLPKGKIGLEETVSSLLASGSLRTVMHLMADERKFEGVGETDLMRGACWAGPILKK
ncbi:MAG: STAS domain-containing protein [Verrucomicrobia bacterium]|nr:STAS domain-containing protein [Verrucomicrobiota bacterium]